MLKIIFYTLLVSFAAAKPQPILKPAFPENVSRRSRIINGLAATEGMFPHQVRLTVSTSTKIGVCGGSIISDRFVLTACHCVSSFSTFTLGFGSIDYNSQILILTSNTKIEHPGFNPSNLNNDIALIQTPSTVAWSSRVSPISLPSYSQVSTLFTGLPANVSGFGQTKETSNSLSSKLMYGNVLVISNADCWGVYGTDIVRDFTLCTRGSNIIKQGACTGDSGGALVWYDSSLGRNIQLGVVSFVSSRGCDTGSPTGFARVTKYLTWINQKTGIVIRA